MTGSVEEHTFDDVSTAEQAWVDPIAENQALTTFQAYPQASRDGGAGEVRGSYQLYLPQEYRDEPGRRFPVIYWLHGGFGTARQGAPVVERIDRRIRQGAMVPSIIVVPQALPIGWYVDSKDGSRPIEQTIVVDLIDHVDASYRTIASAAGRIIEGFSMGGYGALHLGFKYPKLFSRVSAIAPAILRDMALEPDERVANTFFGDHAYYDALGPWTLLLANAPEIRSKVTVRILAGTVDARLAEAVHVLSAEMEALGVSSELLEVEGADHDFADIIDGVGDRYFDFLNS